MNQLIAKFEKVNIDAPLRVDLDQSFVQAFDKVFEFGDGNIKVVGTVNDPWFRAKDILRCMGYSMERNAIVKHLSKLDPYFKSSLDALTLTVSPLIKQDNRRQIDRLNEGREIYVNEPGLYQLIMSSKLESAKPFKSFVYRELLPGIRKIVQDNYEKALAGRDDKIDVLIKQNTLALNKLADLGIQLNVQNEQLDEMNNKLDIAVEDRAPIPEDQNKAERFVFLKRQHTRYPYYVIRSQQTSCKTSLKKQEKEHGPIEILIDFETHPNTKTYYSRIKLNLNKRGVKFCRNEVRIEGDITEEEIVEELKKINDQKRML